MKWSSKEEDFLIKNYNKHGGKYCSEKLNRDIASIYKKAHRLNLKKNFNWRHEEIVYLKNNYRKLSYKYIADKLGKTLNNVKAKKRDLGLVKIPKNNIKFNIKKCLKMPEFIYFLGYFWADGSLSKSNTNYYPRIEINAADMDVLIRVIKKFININNVQKRQRYKNNKKFGHLMSTLSIYDKDFIELLLKTDYHIKSTGVSPKKILKIIGNHYNLYFWRGFFDGDGCCFYGEKYKNVCFWSCYNQDWADLETFLVSNGIVNYKIYRNKRKNGQQSSELLINQLKESQKFYYCIYPINKDDFGLSRKRNKLKLIDSYVKTAKVTTKS